MAARGSERRAWLVAVVAGIVLLVVAVAAVAALTGDDDNVSAGPNVGVTLSDITEDPDEHYGDLVIVSGEVASLAPATFDARGSGRDRSVAFTLGGEGVDEVLVIDASGESSEFLRDEQVVEVIGTVRRFDAVQFDDAYDFNLFTTERWFDRHQGLPVIVASSVDPTVATVEPRERDD